MKVPFAAFTPHASIGKRDRPEEAAGIDHEKLFFSSRNDTDSQFT